VDPTVDGGVEILRENGVGGDLDEDDEEVAVVKICCRFIFAVGDTNDDEETVEEENA